MAVHSNIVERLGLQARERPPLRFADVFQALAAQARVLNALILRETRTRYGKHKVGFLWGLLEPTMSVAVFVAIFAGLRQGSPGGMPLVPFMLTGIVCFSLFKDPWMHMQGTIGQSQNLLAFPQISTFDVILARGLLSVALATFVLVLLLCIAGLIGEDVRVERPLGVLLACLLLATLGIGGGFVIASIEPLVPSIRQIMAPLMGRPLFFGSALFYTVDSIPANVRDYLLWNPILHMIELTRSEYFHTYETHYGSWSYASSWSLGALAVGLLMHRALRKRSVIAAR